MVKVVTWPVLLALVLVAEEGLRLILRWTSSRYTRSKGQNGAHGAAQYGGLQGLVSFSACLIAANRAVETEQPEPYISDPLAAGLCGQEALEARRARDKIEPSLAPPGNGLEPQPRPIPRLIMRTKFFDDVVTAVTWRGAGAGAEPARHSCHAQLAATARGTEGPCLQVVLLGSGLDARPWRLALPPGVRWFEVDRADVLEAKRARLQAMGAQTAAAAAADITAPVAAPAHTNSSTAATAAPSMTAAPPPTGRADHPAGDHGQDSRSAQQEGPQAGGSDATTAAAAAGGGCGGGWRHPLRAAEWSCVAVDLQSRGWSRGLLERGLDRRSPVLWVLEGLLYYLEEADVRALLKEAASVSPPGSVLAASIIRASPNGKPAGSNASAGGASTVPATASAADGGGGPSERADGNGGAPGQGRVSYNLNSQFKWKCREEIPKFLGDCGWRTLESLSWLDAAQSYGLPTAETKASSVFFVTTVLA